MLKEMAEEGKIMAKATKKDGGGQWVFWALQDPADAATPDELAAMDTTIMTLRETLPAQKANLKVLSSKLTTLKSAPTTEELVSLIERLKTENAEKRERLKALKDGGGERVTKEEVDRAEKDAKYWGARRRARLAAFQELEGMLLTGISKEDIWEKAGLEEDTYVKVDT